MEIWRTDANGQLGEQTANKNKHNRTIGRYTYKKQTEPGNEQKLHNICEAQKRQSLKNCTKQEQEHKIEQIKKTKALKWTSSGGKIQRQIDYILINQRYRNSVRLAQNIAGWGGGTCNNTDNTTWCKWTYA